MLLGRLEHKRVRLRLRTVSFEKKLASSRDQADLDAPII